MGAAACFFICAISEDKECLKKPISANGSLKEGVIIIIPPRLLSDCFSVQIFLEMSFSVLELCAGGGGQALGLEMAGFRHAAAVEYESQYCATLRANRPEWDVREQDIRELRHEDFSGVDLLAAGVPCPPFSIASKQLGAEDDRDMFPRALELVELIQPRGVLFENVPGLATAKFEIYRRHLIERLAKQGYVPQWRILHSADFDVPQLRPRFVMVALKPVDAAHFQWPMPSSTRITVGSAILDLMAANGWPGAEDWARKASAIAPTIVGGSKKHGGPDLGPTRAKRQWRELGVDGLGIADSAPDVDFPEDKLPRLTVRMVARIQGFPDEWKFSGGKTWQYRQVGNAFPPKVALAVGKAIRAAFQHNTLAVPSSRHEHQLQLLDKDEKRFLRNKIKRVKTTYPRLSPRKSGAGH